MIKLLVFSVIALLSLLAQANECLMSKPINLGVSDPRVYPTRPIVLQNAKFDRPFQTGGLVEDYEKREMVLEIFNVLVQNQPSPYVGFDFRTKSMTPWWSSVGFAKSVSARVAISGKVEVGGTKTVYKTQIYHGNHPSFEEPAITEVEMIVDGTYLTSMKIMIPQVHPCYVVDNNAYCDYVGRNETLCLKSGTLNR